MLNETDPALVEARRPMTQVQPSTQARSEQPVGLMRYRHAEPGSLLNIVSFSSKNAVLREQAP